MNTSQDVSIASPEYRQFIEQLKARVLSARLCAARAVNCDLILLYWDIGRGIVEKQQALGWGESVVEMVASDLQQAFPGTTGFSPRNLRSAKQLFLSYSDPTIWLQAVAKLPGGAKLGDSEFWNWLRNRNTIEVPGIWEQLKNSDFKPGEFDGIRMQAGLNSFTFAGNELKTLGGFLKGLGYLE